MDIKNGYNNISLDDTIKKWYSIGKNYRSKTQPFLEKVLNKILSDPKQQKFRDINFNKLMEHKIFKDEYVRTTCQEDWFNLLYHSGFEIKKNNNNESRLIIINENIKNCLKYIKKVLYYLSNEYETEFKQKQWEIIKNNNDKRLNTKDKQKQKQIVDNIKKNHALQMKNAKKGIYDVKLSVGERKGAVKR